jgi:hypothetical protein
MQFGKPIKLKKLELLMAAIGVIEKLKLKETTRGKTSCKRFIVNFYLRMLKFDVH